jgi:MoaA/NifB/PqqE/SkfB family radical SAM enzyme
VSCDWCARGRRARSALAEIEGLPATWRAFGTRVVVFTGGEPLYRPDVMAAADLFRAKGMALQLLTSGLGLGRYAEDVAARFQAVTVVAGRPYARAPTAPFARVDVWTRSWRACAAAARAPQVAVWARATLAPPQLPLPPRTDRKSREMKLDQISFLAAAVSSTRSTAGPACRKRRGGSGTLLLTTSEADDRAIVESTNPHARDAFHAGADASRPIPERPRGWVGLYRAHLGQGASVAPACNAPWASLFIEADGDVRPALSSAVGNLRDRPLGHCCPRRCGIPRRLDWRRTRPARRCVCSLKVGLADEAVVNEDRCYVRS